MFQGGGARAAPRLDRRGVAGRHAGDEGAHERAFREPLLRGERLGADGGVHRVDEAKDHLGDRRGALRQGPGEGVLEA